MDTQEFIGRAKQVHGDRYRYDRTVYVDRATKVIVSCLLHGDWTVAPSNHIHRKSGCPSCKRVNIGNLNRDSNSDFITKARLKHSDLYDYQFVRYVNSSTKVKIICSAHGEFLQTPAMHVSGQGCPKCAGQGCSKEEFIERATQVHGNRYDYTETVFSGTTKPIAYNCPEHGMVEQQANSHLAGAKCPKCSASKGMSTGEFVRRASTVHGKSYDYSKVQYHSSGTKVSIVCHKHGEFKQLPSNHLYGQRCPKCARRYQKLEPAWLDSLGVPDTKENRQVPITVDGVRYICDGFDPETKTVYEFWGDSWHGNPKVYAAEGLHPVCKLTYGELHARTVLKAKRLREAGFNLVEIWEQDWLGRTQG